jgi:lipopolysaccharide export system ATP-binding protein
LRLPSGNGSSSQQNLGFGASVRKFLSIFGGRPRRKGSASSFWNIDLTSLGGPITATRTEAVNLPTRKKSPRAPVRKLGRVKDTEPARAEAAKARVEAGQPRRREEAAQAHPRVEPTPAPRPAHSFDGPGGAQARPALGQMPAPRSRHDAAAPQPAREAYLATHSVEKSFGGRKVVRGTSLYVRRGEAVGLLGPNGAGKTTVFYMITGLIKADSGRIELDGHDITKLPMYQRARLGIGYLPQEASIFRGLNVEDNIKAVLEVVEPNKRRRDADLNGLLEEFGITRLRKTPTIALSGGERRRVEIARALASRPNYMLLDEPFAGIDPIAVGDIQDLVRHLTNRGIGVLITDHNVRETLGLVDRAYVIYSGEVLMEGRADDIVNDHEVRRRYLGEEFRM